MRTLKNGPAPGDFSLREQFERPKSAREAREEVERKRRIQERKERDESEKGDSRE